MLFISSESKPRNRGEFLCLMIFHTTFPISLQKFIDLEYKSSFFPNWRGYRAHTQDSLQYASWGQEEWHWFYQAAGVWQCQPAKAHWKDMLAQSQAFWYQQASWACEHGDEAHLLLICALLKGSLFSMFSPGALIWLLSITMRAQQEHHPSLHIAFT